MSGSVVFAVGGFEAVPGKVANGVGSFAIVPGSVVPGALVFPVVGVGGFEVIPGSVVPGVARKVVPGGAVVVGVCEDDPESVVPSAIVLPGSELPSVIGRGPRRRRRRPPLRRRPCFFNNSSLAVNSLARCTFCISPSPLASISVSFAGLLPAGHHRK